MGGNARGYLKSTGEYTQAEKIPVAKIGRQNFIAKMLELFRKMNSDYKKANGSFIWEDETILKNGIAFNGSTSFVMSPEFSDAEIEKYKPSMGDLDIAVPSNVRIRLGAYLDSIEGKEIVPGIVYMGQNQHTLSDQFNCVFKVKIGNIITACQIDFEFLDFEQGKPNEWGKFGHSSSFDDQKEGVKAVFHKFLIRSLIGATGIRRDIVIATKASTPENIKLSNNKVHQIPKMLKFSVQKGIRTAYEPLIDPKTGEVCMVDGKKVYKEIPTNLSTFESSLPAIFKIAFGVSNIDPSEMKLFWSLKGVCALMKKYLSREIILATVERFEELIWGVSPQYAQEIEMNNPQWDYETKVAGYRKMVKLLGVKDNSKALATKYYKAWTKGGDASKVVID